MPAGDEIDVALAELRFADARALAAQLDGDARNEAVSRIERAHTAAVDAGEDLASRILELARNDHYAALLAIAAEPGTERILSVVPEEIRRGAYIHLDSAVRRRELARSAARRHLDEAAKALDEYDPTRAHRHLDKVDTAFLESATIDELTELRARYLAVNAEAREISTASAEIIAQAGPPRAQRGRGCLGTSVLTGLIIGALLALVS